MLLRYLFDYAIGGKSREAYDLDTKRAGAAANKGDVCKVVAAALAVRAVAARSSGPEW